MNIPEDTGMTEMVWEGTEAEKGMSWKFHNEPYPTCPQDCVGNYAKRMNILDASEYEVLHTCSPDK